MSIMLLAHDGVIAIPTGVKIFNWLRTMVAFDFTSTLKCCGFFGLYNHLYYWRCIGVPMSAPPSITRWFITVCLVAHFHMMIVGGGYSATLLAHLLPCGLAFGLTSDWGGTPLVLAGFTTAFLPLYVLINGSHSAVARIGCDASGLAGKVYLLSPASVLS